MGSKKIITVFGATGAEVVAADRNDAAPQWRGRWTVPGEAAE